MYISAVTVVLLMFQSVNVRTNESDETDFNTNNDEYNHVKNDRKPASINETRLDICYWNSDLGNDNPIKIAFGNESNVLDYWIGGLPLKVVTHGWLASDQNSSGVFTIKSAYVDCGGFNVITLDWSSIACDVNYSEPAVLTISVGYAFSKFLNNLVAITNVIVSDIHLIGHSLGAHVLGTSGYYFKHGKIGRITGLDPASPGFELDPIHLDHLDKENAEFVDVIHTSGWNIGFTKSIGHADFFPNGGIAPQPGCLSWFNFLDSIHCSHSRAYELYVDSVYNRKSLVAIRCSSMLDFDLGKCTNNSRVLLGHDAHPSSRGKFFLKTEDSSPYGIL